MHESKERKIDREEKRVGRGEIKNEKLHRRTPRAAAAVFFCMLLAAVGLD